MQQKTKLSDLEFEHADVGDRHGKIFYWRRDILH